MAVQATKEEAPGFDEMYDAGGTARGHYAALARWLADTPSERLLEKRREADLLFQADKYVIRIIKIAKDSAIQHRTDRIVSKRSGSITIGGICIKETAVIKYDIVIELNSGKITSR